MKKSTQKFLIQCWNPFCKASTAYIWLHKDNAIVIVLEVI